MCVLRVAVEAEVLSGSSVWDRVVWLRCSRGFHCHPQLSDGPQRDKTADRYTHMPSITDNINE